MRRFFDVLFFAIVCAVAASPAEAATAVATDVRIEVAGPQTRIVVNFSDNVAPQIFTLADPYRLVVDLPEVIWKLPADWNRAKGGLVQGFRFGPLGPSKSRMVFDLTGPAALTSNLVLPPQGERRYRLVLDLGPAPEAAFRKTAGWPASEAKLDGGTNLPPSAAKPRRARKLICIDPGHGGIDPGASGVSGSLEKNIVLAAALKLRDLLKKSKRYDVVMTRDTDIFLSLRARVLACRRVNADLMISIHADSAGNAGGVRGATVYTLSERASDAEAAELARSENQSDVIAGVEIGREDDTVSSILIDLAQRESKARAARFAASLVPELQKTGRTVPKSHKFAGFRVLKAPDVPSVLLEMGYLTNAEDEKQLLNESWQTQMAQAVLRALDAHAKIEAGRAGAGPEINR